MEIMQGSRYRGTPGIRDYLTQSAYSSLLRMTTSEKCKAPLDAGLCMLMSLLC